ncbi:MAG TPA: MaoC/PaaZ C-terminal domain-containing protein [Myxococcota bacterium]|nr:MaoC/PaaZ C-terminal domain-containing protein [Myxococcota bacterium]
MPVTWDAFKEGDEIPVLKKKPGVTQLVKYAAGGGDFNPLHHDYNFPQSKALGSIIVHGRFKYAALGELVSNWLDHGGRIQKISCQYRGMDFPNQEMTLGGKVVRKYEEAGKKLADLELWAKNEKGQNTTPGSATVRIDR